MSVWRGAAVSANMPAVLALVAIVGCYWFFERQKQAANRRAQAEVELLRSCSVDREARSSQQPSGMKPKKQLKRAAPSLNRGVAAEKPPIPPLSTTCASQKGLQKVNCDEKEGQKEKTSNDGELLCHTCRTTPLLVTRCRCSHFFYCDATCARLHWNEGHVRECAMLETKHANETAKISELVNLDVDITETEGGPAARDRIPGEFLISTTDNSAAEETFAFGFTFVPEEVEADEKAREAAAAATAKQAIDVAAAAAAEAAKAVMIKAREEEKVRKISAAANSRKRIVEEEKKRIMTAAAPAVAKIVKEEEEAVAAQAETAAKKTAEDEEIKRLATAAKMAKQQEYEAAAAAKMKARDEELGRAKVVESAAAASAAKTKAEEDEMGRLAAAAMAGAVEALALSFSSPACADDAMAQALLARGLGQYVDVFLREAFDLSIFGDLTDANDLAEMGVAPEDRGAVLQLAADVRSKAWVPR